MTTTKGKVPDMATPTKKKPAKPRNDKPALQAAPPPRPFETVELGGNLELVGLTTESAAIRISHPSSPRAYTLGIPVAWMRERLAEVDAFVASQAVE